MIPDLIFDIGAHKGDDTAFYVAKGFRVVSVEANPEMASLLRTRFVQEIASGIVTIEECAIGDQPGELDFFVHDHDDWSSLRKNQRFQGENFRIFKVKVRTIDDIVARRGVPYYLKADIESSELSIFDRFKNFPSFPDFVSFEYNGYADRIISIICGLGYNEFKLVEQETKPGQEQAPNPPREGKYVPFEFNGYMSGAFGDELPNDWFAEAELKTRVAELDAAMHKGQLVGWYDIHCRHRSATSNVHTKRIRFALARKAFEFKNFYNRTLRSVRAHSND